jgi:hypothetical protein
MKKINFTIKGNHKDPTGNAVPKLKMTGKQHWTPKAQEYVLWKEHVVYAFLESITDRHEKRMYCHNIAVHGKPIVTAEQHSHMLLNIYWKNFTHGDPENIFGSIADALFHNDKNLDIETVSVMSKDKIGRIEVQVDIFENEQEKLDYLNIK